MINRKTPMVIEYDGMNSSNHLSMGVEMLLART
jgi:hypothetical protein